MENFFLAEWYVLAVHPSSSVQYRKKSWGQNCSRVKCLAGVYAAASGNGKATNNDCLSSGENLGLSHLPYVHFYVTFRKVIYSSLLFVCQVELKLAIRTERCYGKDPQTEKQTYCSCMHKPYFCR